MHADWITPPPAPHPPAPGEVHVWRIPLRPPAPVVQALRATLDAEERERADRFRMQHLTVRFVTGRGAQRDILGRYLGAAPAALRFTVGEYGKPALHPPRLRFNLSNSGDLALLAVAGAGDVGVDVEETRAMPDAEGIARRMYSAAEQRALFALPPAEREAAFLRVWTRKEAFIKAQGSGVWAGLDRFDVSIGPAAALLAVDGSAAEAARWSMRALQPGPGYVAALVTEGSAEQVSLFAWHP